MLAAIGCLIPEILAYNGVAIGEPIWWKVGAYVRNNDVTLNWGGIEGFRIAGKQGIWVIAACQAVLMGGPEYARCALTHSDPSVFAVHTLLRLPVVLFVHFPPDKTRWSELSPGTRC